jgi:uncharacterized protein (DUF58 family)
MPIVPAKRLYLLLLLGIAIAALLAISIDRNISIVITLLYDLAIVALMIGDGLRVKSNRVKIKREAIERLSVGRDNLIKLSLQSGKVRSPVRLRDSYPLQFQVTPQILEATLESNSQQELTYTIHPDSRGEFEWGDIQVRQLGTWKLAWYDWKVPANCKVKIYPDLVGLRSLSLRLTLQNTGAIKQIKRITQGTEFSELKEYTVGDDIRLIDWKATARRSRPLVRVLEPERKQTLIILLDGGRLMTAKVQGLKRFDWGLNSTLSLALAGLHRGDRVGVAVFDRQVTTWIPPERGQHHLSKIIDTLTPIQPVLLEPDYMGAVTKLVNQQTRRALVVLITDIVDVTASAELLGSMIRLKPRYLPFCVTLRDPLVDRIAHTPSQDLKTAYTRAVALDLLNQREVAFAQLKQKGVLVLDAPSDRISEQLVDRYLQLKIRNLL